MGSTRDRILEVSLRLFARDGYEAVSTSAIADELGMTKGALYRHFSNKRAIFDSLVDEMLERHCATGVDLGLATGPIREAASAYAATTPEDMADLGEGLFRLWTTDESAVAFRRMLSLERFRDETSARTYDELFVTGRLRYHETLFAQMIEVGAFEPGDAMQMALDFWSPIYLLMQATDNGMDTTEAVTLVRAHVLSFAASHDRSTR